MPVKLRDPVKPLTQTLYMALSLCLVVAAYYQVKPVSRTLYITAVGSENLPYVWMFTAALLLVLLPFFHWRVKKFSGFHRLCASCLSFAILLPIFRYLLENPSKEGATAFYVLVDVYSVVAIEHCWTVINSTYRLGAGKRWYGIIGSGALLGGALGSALSSTLLKTTNIASIDLLLVGSGLLIAFLILAAKMYAIGLFTNYCEDPAADTATSKSEDKVPQKVEGGTLYVALILILSFLPQLAEPLIEYQFMGLIERSFGTLHERTSYLSQFFFALSAIALVTNLLIAPKVNKRLGSTGGLLVQPLAILAFTTVYSFHGTLFAMACLKISDRSLSYSINRVSRELLYIPLPETTAHRVKVWIDMIGYRCFKIVGSLLILWIATWASYSWTDIASVLILVVILWIVMVLLLRYFFPIHANIKDGAG